MALQLSVFIASTLDGYIATRDNKLDWLFASGAEGEDYGFKEFFASIDAVAMGRGTYNFVADMDPWPYTGKSVYVFTHAPPTPRAEVTFWQKSPLEAVEEWAGRGYQRIYVDGGYLISSFMSAGLIDDLLLTKVPLLLGDGLPLFHVMSRSTDLKLIDVKAFPSGMLNLRYVRA